MSDKAKVVADILGDWGWEDQEAHVEEVQDTGFYVIGMDPGGTTGLAILRIDTEDKKALPELVFLDQIPEGHYGFYDYFERFYINPENSVVASEVWVEHHKKGVDRTPFKIEGVMHALWDDRNVTWQTPAQKVRVSDEFLIENNLWTPGMPHQMDALRHAIIWLLDQEHEGTTSAVGDEDGESEEGDGEGGGGKGKPMAEPGDTDRAQGDGTPLDEDARAELAEMAREMAAKRLEENEKNGGGGGAEGDPEKGDGYGTVDPKGKRKTRESQDGAFMGFVSAEDNEGMEEVSLLDD